MFHFLCIRLYRIDLFYVKKNEYVYNWYLNNMDLKSNHSPIKKNRPWLFPAFLCWNFILKHPTAKFPKNQNKTRKLPDNANPGRRRKPETRSRAWTAFCSQTTSTIREAFAPKNRRFAFAASLKSAVFVRAAWEMCASGDPPPLRTTTDWRARRALRPKRDVLRPLPVQCVWCSWGRGLVWVCFVFGDRFGDGWGVFCVCFWLIFAVFVAFSYA